MNKTIKSLRTHLSMIENVFGKKMIVLIGTAISITLYFPIDILNILIGS